MEVHGIRTSYPALTGLRALLAILVILLHISPMFNLGPLQALAISGNRAVDVFFILSGFILFHSYFEKFKDSVGISVYLAFLQNRLARIYPIHLVTLIIGLAMFIFSIKLMHKIPHDVDTIYAPSLMANLLLVHAWFDGLGTPNVPAWSISAEWFAYLFCPFMILLFRRAHTVLLIVCLVLAVFYAGHRSREVGRLGSTVTDFQGVFHRRNRLCPKS